MTNNRDQRRRYPNQKGETMTNQDRPRIYSFITKSRFLHAEDSLEIGKLRLFVGEYRRGEGASSTAYHFLDIEDARVIAADLAWSKQLDITDYKGSANNGGQPVSRVLKVKGPKDGKYWLEIANGPGQVIGQGAVKPAGEPEAAVSVALDIWEARRLALAITEYLTAYRVVALLGGPAAAPAPRLASLPTSLDTTPGDEPPPANIAAQDLDDLFGPAPVPVIARSKATKQSPTADDPPGFYALAPQAIKQGLGNLVNELVRAPGSWSEKTARLQAAMNG